MTLPLIRYPLDTTGLSPGNYIVDEIHDLANVNIKSLATNYGAYFTESLTVTDRTSNLMLVRGTQYVCVELLDIPTELYAKEICCMILIIDPAVSKSIKVSYNALGGTYTRSAAAAVEIYNLIQNQIVIAEWPDIISKPKIFNPAQHTHALSDVYGFEYVVDELERVRSAITNSNVPAHEGILDWVVDEIAKLRQNTIDTLTDNNGTINIGQLPLVTPISNGIMSNLDKISVINSQQTRTSKTKQYVTSSSAGQVFTNTLTLTPPCKGRLMVIGSLQISNSNPATNVVSISINGIMKDTDTSSLPVVGLTQMEVSAETPYNIVQTLTASATNQVISFGVMYIFIPTGSPVSVTPITPPTASPSPGPTAEPTPSPSPSPSPSPTDPVPTITNFSISPTAGYADETLTYTLKAVNLTPNKTYLFYTYFVNGSSGAENYYDAKSLQTDATGAINHTRSIGRGFENQTGVMFGRFYDNSTGVFVLVATSKSVAHTTYATVTPEPTAAPVGTGRYTVYTDVNSIIQGGTVTYSVYPDSGSTDRTLYWVLAAPTATTGGAGFTAADAVASSGSFTVGSPGTFSITALDTTKETSSTIEVSIRRGSVSGTPVDINFSIPNVSVSPGF